MLSRNHVVIAIFNFCGIDRRTDEVHTDSVAVNIYGNLLAYVNRCKRHDPDADPENLHKMLIFTAAKELHFLGYEVESNNIVLVGFNKISVSEMVKPYQIIPLEDETTL